MIFYEKLKHQNIFKEDVTSIILKNKKWLQKTVKRFFNVPSFASKRLGTVKSLKETYIVV